MDTNDRFLRKITIGQGSTEKGYSRQVGGVFSREGSAVALKPAQKLVPHISPPVLPPAVTSGPLMSQGVSCSPSAGLGNHQETERPQYYFAILFLCDFSCVSGKSRSGCPLNIHSNMFYCQPTQLVLYLHNN